MSHLGHRRLRDISDYFWGSKAELPASLARFGLCCYASQTMWEDSLSFTILIQSVTGVNYVQAYSGFVSTAGGCLSVAFSACNVC